MKMAGINSANKPLKLAIEWLSYAQDRGVSGGVPGWFSFIKGWSPPYPETTGYIAPTFFDYCCITGDKRYKERALKMIDWLLSCQMDIGAFPGHHVGIKPVPRIFNTGMVIFGMLRAFLETKDGKYLSSAKRAGDFLLQEQSEDGSWKRYSYNGFPHSYHSGVSLALVELGVATNDKKYTETARKNLDWVLKQKQKNGWFGSCSFEQGKNPYTHTIGYLIDGLLGSGILLEENKYIDSAIEASERLLNIYEIKKFMPGEFKDCWKGNFSYSCLTGDAQISIIWQKIYRFNNDARFLNAALKINDYLKGRQIIKSLFNSTRGSVFGSAPVWGAYHPFWIPSWAVKFFADCLMLEDKILTSLWSQVKGKGLKT
jgi:uncharacterized protein YyaL (SSP411 family)